MPRYINTEDFKHLINASSLYDTEEWVKVMNLLADTPTADVVERKVGKWIDDKGLYMCSCCKHLWSELWWTAYCPMDRMYKTMPFCPNCGAEMEE